ncbi:MAG: lipopolysaccharide biosynthesis protein [Chitinophagaceae bacterium]
MGIVRKQSILSSIIIYIGFAIGAINILLLFPKYFTPEQIGLTRILLDVALLFATLCTLGAIPITLKFFPFYQGYLPKKKNDLPLITIILGITGSILLLILLPHFKPLIIRKFGARSPLFVEYFDLVYPFAITLIFFSILEAHAWSQKKTVLSNILKEFVFRLFNSVIIILFIAGMLNFDQFINAYAYIFLIPVLIFIYSLSRNGNFPLSFSISKVTSRLKGKMFNFGLFVFGGAILNIIARTNDTIIIASQSSGGLIDAAVFTIATYLITVMDVPQRSLISITTPFIAEAWKNRDLAKIDSLYKKTALNLLISGMAIFSLVLLNIEDAMKFLGKDYQALGMIVLISGIAKLIDLATGLNTQILLLSKYWKLEFLTNMLLVALSIPLNYWLTKRFNVIGPAYGNLIALLVFNAIRFLMIWRIFKLQPFTIENGKAILIGFLVLLLVYMLPDTGHIVINVAIRSLTFILIFGWLILKFNISADIAGLFDLVKSRLKRF